MRCADILSAEYDPHKAADYYRWLVSRPAKQAFRSRNNMTECIIVSFGCLGIYMLSIFQMCVLCEAKCCTFTSAVTTELADSLLAAT